MSHLPTITRRNAYAAGQHGDVFGVIEAAHEAYRDTPAFTSYRVTATIYAAELANPCAALGGKWLCDDGLPNGWEISPYDWRWSPDWRRIERHDTPVAATFEQLDDLVRAFCLREGPPCGDIERFAARRVRVGVLDRDGTVTGGVHSPGDALLTATRALFAGGRA